MNFEYEISLEYDRDRLQAYWEHSFNKGKIVFPVLLSVTTESYLLLVEIKTLLLFIA